MKKLLIFMLVLGLASVANATLQISVGGIDEPLDTEITLTPSEIIILDVWTDAVISAGVGEWNGWALAAQITEASIAGGIVVPKYVVEPGISIFDDAVGVGGIPLPPGENGVWGTILITGVVPQVDLGDTIFDAIEFHCEDDGTLPHDVVVTLYGTMDYVTLVPQDSIIIHQVPEPMTIALLGLGGLFLRRRK